MLAGTRSSVRFDRRPALTTRRGLQSRTLPRQWPGAPDHAPAKGSIIVTRTTPTSADSAIPPGSVCAVITGDVVGSSTLAPDARRRLLDVMHDAGAQVRDRFADELPLPMDVFSGDSWQVLVTRPAASLRIALAFRANLRAAMASRRIDTRLVIAIDTVDFVPDQHVSQGEGQAFRTSGRTLADLKSPLCLALRAADEAAATPWDAGFSLLDVIARRLWTPARARAVYGALCGETQDEIAHRWDPPIAQPSVSGHLQRAAWSRVEPFIESFEAAWATV